MMLIALAISLASQTALGPSLPPGVRPELSTACVEVEAQLEKGNFDGARKLLWLLPKKSISVVWDDSKVPASFRSRFASARDRALAEWSHSLSEVEFKLVPDKGDLRFSFERKLAASADTGLPAGSALFFSESPTDPRLDVVIGLNRGNPLEQTDDINIQNEVAYAAGSYLGLAPTPFIGSFMGRTDLPMKSLSRGAVTEYGIAQSNLLAAAVLRNAVDKKIYLAPARPVASTDPGEVVQGPVLQGTKVEFSVGVTNIGTGTLKFRALPDCGCISTLKGQFELGPGESKAITVHVDTTEYGGLIDKRLVLFSNDVEVPIRSIPLKITSTPRYRLLSSAPSTMIVPQGGAKFDLYLVTPDKQPLDVIGYKLEGITGSVKFSHWKGQLADPELNEQAKPRTGTKFHVELDESPIAGRSPFTLVVRTADKAFEELRYNAAVQKGIVALPDHNYLGEVGKDPLRSSVLISRPGMPFKILSAESSSSFLTVSVKPSRENWEYKLQIEYKGGAPKGDFQATVTVKTDDPKQPTVEVAVQAIVR